MGAKRTLPCPLEEWLTKSSKPEERSPAPIFERPARLRGLTQERLDDKPMKRSNDFQVGAPEQVVAMNDRGENNRRRAIGTPWAAVENRGPEVEVLVILAHEDFAGAGFVELEDTDPPACLTP